MTLQGAIEAEYLPHDDEPFMCDRQKAFFRRRLLQLKEAAPEKLLLAVAHERLVVVRKVLGLDGTLQRH